MLQDGGYPTIPLDWGWRQRRGAQRRGGHLRPAIRDPPPLGRVSLTTPFDEPYVRPIPALTTIACSALLAIACGTDSPTDATVRHLVVALDSGSVRISPTRTTSTTAIVSRLGVPGDDITLAVSGLPSGVHMTIGTASHTDQATLIPVMLAGDVTAPPGIHHLTVTATAANTPAATISLRLIVSDLVRVSLLGCSAAARPLWFAVQDGNEPLREMQPTDDEYRFAPESDHAGFYYVVADADSFSTRGVLQTRQELLAAPIALCESSTPTTPTGVPVPGVVTGLAGLERVYISLGGTADTARRDGPFSVMSGPDPVHDLIAIKFGFLPSTPNRLLIRRDVDVMAGTLGTLDMNVGAPEAMVPASTLLTFDEPPEYIQTHMRFHSGASCSGVSLYARTTGASATGTIQVWGVPSSALRATDWHELTVGGGYPNRSVTTWFRDIAPFHVAFGPVPAETEAYRMEAYRGLGFPLDIPGVYDQHAELSYANIDPTSRFVRITASRGWLAAVSDTLRTPDFAATPGWNPAWEPGFDHWLRWGVRLVGRPGGAPCTAGVHQRDAAWGGTSTGGFGA